MDNLSIV